MELAVIGDVGGHADELAAALVDLGADPTTGTIPDGLVIYRVGDLVHRGPNSSDVLAIVERFGVNGSGRWVRLLGSHEAQYTHDPLFNWSEVLR